MVASGLDGIWPADADTVARARRFIAGCAQTRTAVACDSDVDGLTSAVIMERALQGICADVVLLPVRRGEHAHSESMRARIGAVDPERLIVLDLGSRPSPIVAELPTLIIDHHNAAAGVPPDAIVVNGWDREPVATSSVLTFVVTGARPVDAWLAALGAVADLGRATAFASMLGRMPAARTASKAASLLNAARRAPEPDPSIALALLRKASAVTQITSGEFAETAVLEAKRRIVQAETDRCSRVAPTVIGGAALIRFSSGAQVHPIVAIRWARRLSKQIVIAANDGYIPGRVNFAIRSAADIDLIAWLRELAFTANDPGEYANGHRRATGGSLSHADFDRFVEVLS